MKNRYGIAYWDAAVIAGTDRLGASTNRASISYTLVPMFYAFDLPGKGPVVANKFHYPRLPAVNWHRLYPVNDARTVHRLAPVFPTRDSAVLWLEELMEQRRASWKLKPKRIPDFLVGDRVVGDVGSYGMGPSGQYDGFSTHEQAPVLSYLFRGERTVDHPSIPTLLRSVWPALVRNKLDEDAARATLREEQEITSRFIGEFFSRAGLCAEFPWIDCLSDAEKAGIARHYCFFSWFLDFTVDPRISAVFATANPAPQTPNSGFGAIHVLDEELLAEWMGGGPLITQHRGYQRRQWTTGDVRVLQKRTALELGSERCNYVGTPGFWTGMIEHQGLSDGFSMASHYVPGISVERMWNQRWCAFEIGEGLQDLASIVLGHQILLRLICPIRFSHEVPAKGQDKQGADQEAFLMAPYDDFSIAVERYKTTLKRKPGQPTKELLRTIRE